MHPWRDANLKKNQIELSKIENLKAGDNIFYGREKIFRQNSSKGWGSFSIDLKKRGMDYRH